MKRTINGVERDISPGADLSDADLSDANLTGASLYGASLCDASLCDANLCDADLYGADLRGAYLHNANLEGSRINRIDNAVPGWSVTPDGTLTREVTASSGATAPASDVA